MANTKLDICGLIVKIVFILVNILFLVVGLAMVGLGIYLAVLSMDYSGVIGTAFIAGGVGIILAGLCTAAIAVLGLVAAIVQLRPLLVIYAIIIIIIILLEVAFAIYIFTQSEVIIDMAESEFNETMNAYGNSTSANDVVDFYQSTFGCCGVSAPEDWFDTDYYGDHSNLPPSCCFDLPENQPCEVGTNNTYSDGCYTKTMEFVYASLDEIGAIAIVVGLVEILGVILAFWLCCSIGKNKRKEESKLESAVEGHLPWKVRCTSCLAKVCPCFVQPPVPASM